MKVISFRKLIKFLKYIVTTLLNEYKSRKETHYLLKSPANKKRLLESLEELRRK